MRRVHEDLSNVLREQYVHDIDLLDDDAVWLELLAHFMANLCGHFSFDITDSVDFDSLDEITEMLLTFLLKQLLKTIWSEVVEEFDNVLLLVVSCAANVEIDANTKRNVHIIFCWNVVNGALESDCVLGDEGGDTLVGAVHPMGTWTNQTCISSKGLFERVHTIWNIELALAAARVIFKEAHNWYALTMGSGDLCWS